jgi:Putative antitoxin of bacterial toxin-antitoxin system, YdaS/YdaT
MLSGVLKEVVEKCGGVAVLAQRLGVSRQAIYAWRTDGIPYERIHELSRMTDIPRKELETISRGHMPTKKKWWE